MATLGPSSFISYKARAVCILPLGLLKEVHAVGVWWGRLWLVAGASSWLSFYLLLLLLLLAVTCDMYGISFAGLGSRLCGS